MERKRKTVIIGGVAGGASCAARLRRLDNDREIVILERGDYISYANCGLPYRVGNIITNREALILMSPQLMRDRFRIDVRVKNEVVSINRQSKTVHVKEVNTGREYDESYDDLVIATGSSPLQPYIDGIDSPRVKTIWTVNDTEDIKKTILKKGVSSAAIVGGGFIGLEMAENLHKLGIKVSICEAANQVMPPLDLDLAQLLHEHLVAKGIELHLADAVSGFTDNGNSITVELESGKKVTVDLVILAIGVRPNSVLARDCGLRLNLEGGILVDEHMRTEDPSVYAVGDAVEVQEFVFGGRTMIPLAGPANKQGRIAADNLAGRNEVYRGTQGTSIAKVFDLTAASTGMNEKKLIDRGMVRGIDYESLIIIQNSHANYYPGASPMTLKLLFSKDGKKIFGAQIVGRDGVDKRIDTLSTAIRLGAGVRDLKELELAYAPPYSSPKDPVNMAGFVAENILTGLVRISEWDRPENRPDAVLLDVRENSEVEAYSIPNAVNIPLGQLRDRLNELDKQKEVIVFCAIGVRAYNASRILSQNGFANVSVYPGGARFYRSSHAVPVAVPVEKPQEEIVRPPMPF